MTRATNYDQSEDVSTIESETIIENRKEAADRDRLITKGKSVLDLCIEQNKLLCVQGFVDSQIERGGLYLDVVRAMREYLATSLTEASDRSQRTMMRDLHGYIDEKLGKVQELVDVDLQ